MQRPLRSGRGPPQAQCLPQTARTPSGNLRVPARLSVPAAVFLGRRLGQSAPSSLTSDLTFSHKNDLDCGSGQLFAPRVSRAYGCQARVLR